MGIMRSRKNQEITQRSEISLIETVLLDLYRWTHFYHCMLYIILSPNPKMNELYTINSHITWMPSFLFPHCISFFLDNNVQKMLNTQRKSFSRCSLSLCSTLDEFAAAPARIVQSVQWELRFHHCTGSPLARHAQHVEAIP